jgi:CRISPR-associated exonuclease Cas4
MERTVFTVTDLKQYAYCPRIVFYTYCLPLVRPTTGKMDEGRLAHEEARDRERRRTLRIYGLENAQRHFDVWVASDQLGLTGRIDLVLEVAPDSSGSAVAPDSPGSAVAPDLSGSAAAPDSSGIEWIPVDYKQTARRAGPHLRRQLAAYGIMLEETWGGVVRRGFIYSLLTRRAEEVLLTAALRREVRETVAGDGGGDAGDGGSGANAGPAPFPETLRQL